MFLNTKTQARGHKKPETRVPNAKTAFLQNCPFVPQEKLLNKALPQTRAPLGQSCFGAILITQVFKKITKHNLNFAAQVPNNRGPATIYHHHGLPV